MVDKVFMLGYNMIKKIKCGEKEMLKKFEVKNFKGFKERLVLDLSSPREYLFNKELVKNDIVNKALVFGRNGSGKSNLGLAIFDITLHLTEKRKTNTMIGYTHGDSPRGSIASFKYVFQFGKDEIVYEYEKYTPVNLRLEKISINGKQVIYYNHDDKSKNFVSIPEAETLNIGLDRNDQSIVRYIYRNTILGANSVIARMMLFVDNMLWFRSLKGNEFSGYKKDPENLADMIETEENLNNFAKFLKENGIDYNLGFNEDIVNNTKHIIAKFKHNAYLFDIISSRGTEALWLYYCWSLEFDKISFLFLDEFDAFYHYETAEYVLKLINENSNFQAIVTSHNTSLLNNSITRPDCSFIISNNKISSLCNCTEKEIREAHNLEKMYRNDIFEN